MAGPDFSEYEQRRAESHETAWRFAATFVNISSRQCRFRLCRRYQACCGPMLPSDHQRGQIRAQKEIGLSGTACASLPLCMAQATTDRYTYLREVSEKLAALQSTEFKGYTTWEFLHLLRQDMRIRHRSKPPSP